MWIESDERKEGNKYSMDQVQIKFKEYDLKVEE